MNNFQKILNSFSLQKTLNPKVWENPEDPKDAKLNPKVKKGLMRIAEEFIDYLGEDVFVEDIILTGSLANFNWSEFSDFDLHILIDFQQYEKEAELYKEMYDLKKYIFNEKHDIKIYGYDVELYAQDTEESHFASGVYSLMNNEWLTEPKKVDFELDRDVLENKIKCWTDKIDTTLESTSTTDDKKILEKLKDKLKEYRKSGLEKEGELSYENLVFKFLRRSGHIQKLFDMKDKLVDKELSVENKLES
jgi:predicted nucleotidyltransferase